MKKINFSNLSFQEGKSDKVYEVDLVEQMSRESERYYVNFRYGRRGANLREGTKTTQPVSLEQAERKEAKKVEKEQERQRSRRGGFPGASRRDSQREDDRWTLPEDGAKGRSDTSNVIVKFLGFIGSLFTGKK